MKVLERLPESRDKLSMLPQGRVGLKERRQAGPIMSLRSDERNKAPHVRYQFMESCRGENVSGSQSALYRKPRDGYGIRYRQHRYFNRLAK
jgi:hypothetical protein